MYVDKSKALPAHGEDLIQRLGRLNTIETFSLEDAAKVPKIHLWASDSFHRVHCHYIHWLQTFVRLAQREQNGRKALEKMKLYKTGDKYCKTFPTQASRTAFSPMQHKVPRKGEQLVPLPDRTSCPLILGPSLFQQSVNQELHFDRSELQLEARVIQVSSNDLLLRQELLVLSTEERILVPNIIKSIRESENLNKEDPSAWTCWKDVWQLLIIHRKSLTVCTLLADLIALLNLQACYKSSFMPAA